MSYIATWRLEAIVAYTTSSSLSESLSVESQAKKRGKARENRSSEVRKSDRGGWILAALVFWNGRFCLTSLCRIEVLEEIVRDCEKYDWLREIKGLSVAFTFAFLVVLTGISIIP